MTRDEIIHWPDALQTELDSARGLLCRITVLRETDSTQDAARWIGATVGDVIVAGRQTHGRGRLGSAWADTEEQGIAMTFVLPREQGERYAFASAVAAAMAVESLVGDTAQIAIKWPNDIYANGRKLAGILIEQHDEFAHIGIGMNISQRIWPNELTGRTVSLAELYADVTRLDAQRALLRTINDVLEWPAPRLAKAYHARHLLRDQVVEFQLGAETCAGRVVGLCIERGLEVETDSGMQWLPAAKTRVIVRLPSDRADGRRLS